MGSGVLVRDDDLEDEAASGFSPEGSVRRRDDDEGLRPLSDPGRTLPPPSAITRGARYETEQIKAQDRSAIPAKTKVSP